MFFHWLSEVWIDLGTVLFAVAASFRRAVAMQPTITNVHKAIVNTMNGAALFPFLVLTLVPFSHDVLDAVVRSSKVSFALAGVIGSIWTINELRR